MINVFFHFSLIVTPCALNRATTSHHAETIWTKGNLDMKEIACVQPLPPLKQNREETLLVAVHRLERKIYAFLIQKFLRKGLRRVHVSISVSELGQCSG